LKAYIIQLELCLGRYERENGSNSHDGSLKFLACSAIQLVHFTMRFRS